MQLLYKMHFNEMVMSYFTFSLNTSSIFSHLSRVGCFRRFEFQRHAMEEKLLYYELLNIMHLIRGIRGITAQGMISSSK